jgi:hypothetical protein
MGDGSYRQHGYDFWAEGVGDRFESRTTFEIAEIDPEAQKPPATRRFGFIKQET